jgi:predicted TIM-barrel enzyme
MKILPVIHQIDAETSVSESQLAFDAGADGVFLISHFGNDELVVEVAKRIKALHPDKLIGINLLADGAFAALDAAISHGLDMAWGDTVGVSSSGLTVSGMAFHAIAQLHPEVAVFAGVAFKGQHIDPDPPGAAAAALECGYVPTTSGVATGKAANIAKIIAMSERAGGTLAIASGMTLDNVAEYAPYLSHILVATGVSRDEHHFDYERLRTFIGRARNAAKAAAAL